MQNFNLLKETNTYGRDDFSIHGGAEPGSAAYIDMTGQMNAFTSGQK